MAISPQNNEKNVFYTGKLYGLTGMHSAHEKQSPDAVKVKCICTVLY